MPKVHLYYIYILSSRSRTLYVGVTNKLYTRVGEHRAGTASKFTKQYKVHRLVYYERYKYIRSAIRREKYLKHWTRAEKVALITKYNPTWEDLAAELTVKPLSKIVKADPPPAAKDDKFDK